MKTLLYILFIFFAYYSVNAQDRLCDPVIVNGSEVNCLLGRAPSSIVGFKYEVGSGWTQIPIQIDERVLLDVSAPYGNAGCGGSPDANNPWDILYYADPTSHIGLDTNPSFDNDDELVFMAMDAGEKVSELTTNPSGVLGNRCELSIFDPVEQDTLGYVYLFEQDGSLTQDAGIDYVSYDFVFFPNGDNTPGTSVAEDYIMCYQNETRNTEHSKVVTSDYESGFSARWTEDELKLKTGNTNQSILDIHQITLDVQQCLRFTTSFSTNRGVIVSTIDGPVRAIRSVMGTNSGRYNQLTIFFTKCQAYYRNDFRVHDGVNANISQAYDMLDFTNAMNGASYSNQYNTNPVIVDGNKDNLNNNNVPAWALYEGNQGSIVTSAIVQPSPNIQVVDHVGQIGAQKIQLASDAYYDDSGSGTSYTCTGDRKAIGTSGWVFYSNGCFDRRYDTPKCNNNAFVGELILSRTNYYLPPGVTNAIATRYAEYVTQPLTVTVNETDTPPSSTVCNHPDDYTALRALYLATNGDNWTMKEGWPNRTTFESNPTPPTDTDMSNWAFVNCDSAGRVVSIEISDNNLTGNLPSEIGLLSELTSLSITSETGLTGIIPTTITQLSKLNTLTLDDNQHTGRIPAELGSLVNLNLLTASNNLLEGCFAEQLYGLCEHATVQFDDNIDLPGQGDFDAFCAYSTGACNNSTCVPDMSITIAPTQDGVYTARTTITSSVNIADTLHIIYQAGDSITLLAGFHADAGATFTAQIDSCQLDMDVNVSRIESRKTDRKNPYQLGDAHPNPASAFVQLDYQLNLDYEQAQILVVDLFGRPQVSVPLPQKQHSKIEIEISDWQDGLYFYSLIVDGKRKRTKQMVIAR